MNPNRLCVKALSILAALPLALVACGERSPEDLHRDDLATSEFTCERAVKNQLRDPGSAEFDRITIIDEEDIAVDATEWTVEGVVRAKNAFGGYAEPAFWSCTVMRPDGPGSDHSARAEFVDLGKLIEEHIENPGQ